MRNIVGLGGAFVFSLIACGGHVGDAVRPKDLTSTDALGNPVSPTTCTGEPKLATPLVIDLDSASRIHLEAGMKEGKKGIVVVAYDCKTVRVLPTCHLDGIYDYTAVSKKESVVQLKSQDELSVNLPLSAGKLGAEMKAGRSIDLALVLVGLRSTTVGKAQRDALTGECEGATHFIQNASVGAFSMATGSIGHAAAVADLFGVGAKGSSDSARTGGNMDGLLDSCRGQSKDAASPPDDCRSPLSLQLLPLTAAAKATDDAAAKAKPAEDKDAAPAPKENPCREGYTFAGGICTKTPAETAHLCAPRDYDDCKVQCAKGSGDSCYAYGSWIGTPIEIRSDFYKKACDLGVADGCGSRAIFDWNAAKDQPPTSPAKAAAIKLAQLGCDNGGGFSCQILGLFLWGYGDDSLKDTKNGVAALKRSCKLGTTAGCSKLAHEYWYGKGDDFPKNIAKSIDYSERACDGGDTPECLTLGENLASKEAGALRDVDRALKLVGLACKDGWFMCGQAVDVAVSVGRESDGIALVKDACETEPISCEQLGDLYSDGKITKKNPAKAREAYVKGCQDGKGSESACKKLTYVEPSAPAKPKARPKPKKK